MDEDKTNQDIDYEIGVVKVDGDKQILWEEFDPVAMDIDVGTSSSSTTKHLPDDQGADWSESQTNQKQSINRSQPINRRKKYYVPKKREKTDEPKLTHYQKVKMERPGMRTSKQYRCGTCLMPFTSLQSREEHMQSLGHVLPSADDSPTYLDFESQESFLSWKDRYEAANCFFWKTMYGSSTKKSIYTYFQCDRSGVKNIQRIRYKIQLNREGKCPSYLRIWKEKKTGKVSIEFYDKHDHDCVPVISAEDQAEIEAQPTRGEITRKAKERREELNVTRLSRYEKRKIQPKIRERKQVTKKQDLNGTEELEEDQDYDDQDSDDNNNNYETMNSTEWEYLEDDGQLAVIKQSSPEQTFSYDDEDSPIDVED